MVVGAERRSYPRCSKGMSQNQYEMATAAEPLRRPRRFWPRQLEVSSRPAAHHGRRLQTRRRYRPGSHRDQRAPLHAQPGPVQPSVERAIQPGATHSVEEEPRELYDIRNRHKRYNVPSAQSTKTVGFLQMVSCGSLIALSTVPLQAQPQGVEISAAGIAGVNPTAPGAEVLIYAVELQDNTVDGRTVQVGDPPLATSGIQVTISDLTVPTGVTAADFTGLNLYRSADAALDVGDTFLKTETSRHRRSDARRRQHDSSCQPNGPGRGNDLFLDQRRPRARGGSRKCLSPGSSRGSHRVA